MDHQQQLLTLLASAEEANIKIGLQIASNYPGFSQVKAILEKLVNNIGHYLVPPNAWQTLSKDEEKPYCIALLKHSLWLPIWTLLRSNSEIITLLPWTGNEKSREYSLYKFYFPAHFFIKQKDKFEHRMTRKDQAIQDILDMQASDPSSVGFRFVQAVVSDDFQPKNPMDEKSVSQRTLQSLRDGFIQYFWKTHEHKKSEVVKVKLRRLLGQLNQLYWQDLSEQRSNGFDRLFGEFCQPHKVLTTTDLAEVLITFVKGYGFGEKTRLFYSSEYQVYGRLGLPHLLSQIPEYIADQSQIVKGVEYIETDRDGKEVQETEVLVILAKQK